MGWELKDNLLKNTIIVLSVVVILITSTFVIILPMVSGAGSLYNVIVVPTNNLFNLESFYAISFTTATDGTINNVTLAFPSGFNVTNVKFIESIGGGFHLSSASGQTITLAPDVLLTVSHGTTITVMLGNIINNQVVSNTVTITTRDQANSIIDGPTKSPPFTLRSVGVGMIGNGAVTTQKISNGAVTSAKISNGAITSSKISESFIKQVTLLDNLAGNSVGWNPDHNLTTFTISDSTVTNASIIPVTVISGPLSQFVCGVYDVTPGASFSIRCTAPVLDNAILNYAVMNP